MADKLKWGILGTGAIAKKFASGLPMCGAGDLVAVGSRAQETAEAFSGEFGGKGYDSYDAVLADPEVQAVYISLPHHLHKEWTIKCAAAGKHILCEKPFTLTADDAREALQAVKAADVFFMEAFMYRCHPQTITLKQLLNEGIIGTPLVMHGDFGYRTQRTEPHFRADATLGGGALWDVGCYPISMARLIGGGAPGKVMYTAQTAGNGYDSVGSGLMEFPSGFRATFSCAVHCQMTNHVAIHGEKGSILLTDPWFCNGQLLVQLPGQKPEPIKVPAVPQLWGNQSVVVAQFLEKRQAPFMSWDDTLGNVRVLEAMQKSAGLKLGS